MLSGEPKLMKSQDNWEQKVLEIKTLNVNGMPLKNAIQIHNWSIAMYRNYHRRLNLPRSKPRIYNTNINYFKDIQTEDQAYFLGFIYADGCIHIPKSGRSSKVLAIKIHEKDGYILDILSNLITPQKNKRHICELGPTNKLSNMVVYAVNSDEIYNDLYNLGVRPRKSLEGGMIFPVLNNDLYPHFIRGFLDGDGWISFRKDRNTCNVGFCSTCKDFLLEIQNLFNFKFTFSLKNNKDTSILGNLPVYNLSTESRKNVLYLKEYLYKNATIFLKRKFENINKVIAS